MVTTLDQLAPHKRQQRQREKSSVKNWVKSKFSSTTTSNPYGSQRSEPSCWRPSQNVRLYLSAILIVLLFFSGEQKDADKKDAKPAVRTTTAPVASVATTPAKVVDTGPATFCKDCKPTTTGSTTCGQLVQDQVTKNTKTEAKATEVIAAMYKDTCCQGTGASTDAACPPKRKWCPECSWFSMGCFTRAQFLSDTYGLTRDNAQISLMLEEPDQCSKAA